MKPTAMRLVVHLLALGLSLGTTAGCANMFLKGARTHAGFPTDYKARYSAPTCQVMATGQKIAGPPGTTFFIVQDRQGPRLLELDAAGKGSAIHNSWRDDTADYYFVMVRRQGWLYAIPRNATRAPARYVYTGRGFSVVERDGLRMPVGQPTVACPMVKL